MKASPADCMIGLRAAVLLFKGRIGVVMTFLLVRMTASQKRDQWVEPLPEECNKMLNLCMIF